MSVDVKAPLRTAKQLVYKDGEPHASVLTSNIWIGSSTIFSQPTEGNKVTPFLTGKAYFADLITECGKANTEICIFGWQVAWDAQLARGVRLYDVLLAAAKKGVKVYVMPWDDREPIQTYDDQTKSILESINDVTGVSGKPVSVLLSHSGVAKNEMYFAHHQKGVIIDRSIAYIGGIDLTYGRYDDEKYDLQADKDERKVLNRYNGCVVATLPIDGQTTVIDPDLMTGAADNFSIPKVKIFGKSLEVKSTASETASKAQGGAHQVPYKQASTPETVYNANWFSDNNPDPMTLDPRTQPRMPWQDFHSRIEGPAVSDCLRNFVLRWNVCGGKQLALPKPPKDYNAKGNAFVQVLRSVPEKFRKAEYKARASKNGVAEPTGTEQDIYLAMLQLIQKSRRFIYIENQFFVGDFGQLGGPTGALSPAAQFIKDGPTGLTATSELAAKTSYQETVRGDVYASPRNQLCQALIERIKVAILDVDQPKFHVYITLPVHSEGMLNNATVAVQIYWTMQTLVFGSKSLLNGIRRALKVRELTKIDDANHVCRDHSSILDDETNTEYESIPIEQCFEYVTLLNLRNWAKLPGMQPGDERYVTEQIYVHTKLMIVDDLYAIFGSANINDRSLTGEGDSETAVLVMDGDSGRADTNGAGSQRLVRKFAHELRMNIWKKLFGITSGVRPAQELLSAIEAPGIPDSWRRIQAQANKNAAAYEAAFPFIPRNWSGRTLDNGEPEPGSILPTWRSDEPAPPKAKWKKGNIKAPLSFQTEFWSAPQHDPANVSQLENIKGYVVALPIHWTEGEHIKFAFPTPLVADNDLPTDTHLESSESRVAKAGPTNRAASYESGKANA